jgi:5-hydroxyisourate hydrolase-like protein (transthyretin family)
VFNGLKAAVYRILIEGNGYVRQLYGQNFTLAPSQVVKGITVRLNPTGTVSGRIRDRETQQPVSSVPVQLMRLEYRAFGERSLVAQPGAVRTNDRGEYRLYFITPGRYYISAGGALPTNSGVRGLNNSNEITADYASVLYPGVLKTQDATLVDVKPGADLGGLDLLVGKHVLYRIRGRVLDSKTGQPPTSFRVSLFRRSDTQWERWQGVTDLRDGFAFSGLVPG